MKITYINKDFISEGFIKTVDKMKDNAGKKYTADDIRKEAKKFVVESILKNREFLNKCENCFKQYIHRKEGSSSPMLNFKYVDLDDKVLTVICDARYSTINIYDYGNEFWIDDTKINKYSVEEINNEIDDYCTKRMLQYFKKKQSELLEYVDRIHIERINLWLTPVFNDIDDSFPETLAVKTNSDFYTGKILNKAEFDELLDKVNSLFSFCARSVLIEKLVPTIEEHKDKLANDVAALLDGNNYVKQPSKHASRSWNGIKVINKFDNLTLDGLARKDLHEFTLDIDVKVLDLHTYLTNNDIEKSTVEESSPFWTVPDINIITTASYSEIEQIKCQIATFIYNVYHNSAYRETEGRYLPISKSGVIKYLLAAYKDDWPSDTNPYMISIDYIHGEYHNAYYTSLRK